MRFAFHFDRAAAPSFIPLEEAFFRALLRIEGEIHVKLRRGSLIWPDGADGDIGACRPMDRLLDRQSLGWFTVHPAILESRLVTSEIFVIVVDGLSKKQTFTLDVALGSNPDYLGAIQIDLANPVHWAVYDQGLPRWARLVGSQLRLFTMRSARTLTTWARSKLTLPIPTFDDGDRDTGTFAHWQSTELFARVDWEDIGVQGTILDPYWTLDHHRRQAELEEAVGDHLGLLGSQLMLRIEDLDPRLRDPLHSAFLSFARYETAEDLAHAAVSCRRFLSKLADALFPPRDGLVKGRKVGNAEYKNRLWAYVEERLKESERERKLIVASLEDLGHRIDRISDLASKGVHDDTDRGELARLLTSLLVVSHDILSLAPPPLVGDLRPYEGGIKEFLHEVLGRADDPRAPRNS